MDTENTAVAIARKMATSMIFQTQQRLAGTGDLDDFNETRATFFYSLAKIETALSAPNKEAILAATALYEKTVGTPQLKALEALATIVEHVQ